MGEENRVKSNKPELPDGKKININNVQNYGEPKILECVRLSSDGAGVCYDDGMATFVPGMLPGEKGKVQIEQRKKSWQKGKLIELETKAPERVEPPCSVYKICGGCQLQHMTYEQTLEWKRRWVEDALLRIGKVKAEVKPVLGMKEPWRYRNKAVLHRAIADNGKDEAGQIGYYRGKTNEIVAFSDCLLLSEEMNQWVRELEKVLGNQYPEVKNITLRQSILPSGKKQGLLLLEQVPMIGQIPGEKEYDVDIKASRYEQKMTDLIGRAESYGIDSVWGMTPKGELIHLAGEKEFTANISGIDFTVSPMAFLQVNSSQTEVLYAEALKMANLTGKERVWDLYCGIGTLTLSLAKQAKSVVGIEENPYAVESAQENAMHNGLEYVSFIEGKVENKINELGQAEKPDVVVLDPPRAGLERKITEELGRVKPERIVYVSCDPGTLARDVGLLVKDGYVVRQVQPVDMFPWANHTETVILLHRLES